jgi:hypothetical protein
VHQSDSQTQTDPQAGPFVEITEVPDSQRIHGGVAEPVFEKTRPAIVEMLEGHVSRYPFFEVGGDAHDHAHERIGSVEQSTRISAGVLQTPLPAHVPKGKRRGEYRRRVGLLGSITHLFTETSRLANFLE